MMTDSERRGMQGRGPRMLGVVGVIRNLVTLALFVVTSWPVGLHAASHASSAVAAPMEGFVQANGVNLQYLDWGGSGKVLIFVHGLGDNPHVFDDLAPAFAAQFHVIAYARRGSGSSEARAPYDLVTLTDDLRGLMDALAIHNATLVGHSAGGDEITEMAAESPERIARLIYLDAAYDWADPDFHAAYEVLPFKAVEDRAKAMSSLDAYRSYQKTLWYPSLDDMRRIEANLRAGVIIQPDGSLKDRMSKEVVEALYSALWTNKPREYERVRCPVLAIYPDHVYDPQVSDPLRREAALQYEQKYWDPFRRKSIERIQREVADVEVVHVSGAHASFFLTDRLQVVQLMRRFLTDSLPPAAK